MTLAYVVVSVLAVGSYAFRDLSRPEAWTYWKDLFIKPSLSAVLVQNAYQDDAGRSHPALALSGEIGPAAASFFHDRLREAHLVAGDAVFFSSPGGNVDQALIMGEVIRAHGLATGVGAASDGRLQASYCASACVFAYAGGVVRLGFPGSRLGVHRFTSSGPSMDPVAATQRTAGIILGYMIRIGISPSIVEAMSATREIRWLDSASMVDSKLVSQPMTSP